MNSTRTSLCLCTVIDEGEGIGWVVSLFLSLFVRSVSFLSDDALSPVEEHHCGC